MPLNDFLQRLTSRKARIAVVGLGYVGLPLALLFARKGFHVSGIDSDLKKIAALRKGTSYILDVPSRLLKEARIKKNFHATSDYRALSNVNAVIVCVPTPLNKIKEPDISYVVRAVQGIASHLKKGQLIVLESTTYPGTTDEVVVPILEKSSMKADKDFFVAFSPERVDPGNQDYSPERIPKVVGGVGPASTKAAFALYQTIIDRIVPVSTARTAEMTKLLENTYRSVNIALVNEMAVLCRRFKIDIWEVIQAAKTKPFGFMPFYPGPGIGGHCLPIDPLYLSWKSRKHGFEARVIELAAQVNQMMPDYVVERVNELLSERSIPLSKAKILLLGMAYKKDIDDARESPALEVAEKFIEKGAKVTYADPLIGEVRLLKRSLKASKLTPTLLRSQDCIVVLTDHSAFDYKMILANSKQIFDTRNALRNQAGHEKIHFL